METKNDTPFHLADLIMRVLNNVATPQEMLEYEQWLASDANNKTLIERVANHTTLAQRYRERCELDSEHPLRKIRAEVASLKLRRYRFRMMRYAAVVVVCAMASLYGILHWGLGHDEQNRIASCEPTLTLSTGEVFKLGSEQQIQAVNDMKIDVVKNEILFHDSDSSSVNEKPLLNKLHVPKGSSYKMTLPDGSHVWLNAESELTFSMPFNRECRRVTLSGEAYFEVVKNTGVPFVVQANDTKVTVHGTSFNVTAYHDDPSVTTTLVSGVVEVATAGKAVKLSPGQQAVIKTGDTEISVVEVATSTYTSWISGVIVFENLTLKEISARLERWYDVQFEFVGDAGDERFSGGAWMKAPLKEFLDNIELVTDIKFTTKGESIIVTHEPKKHGR